MSECTIVETITAPNVFCKINKKLQTTRYLSFGSGCGSVASNTRGLRFKSSQWQNLYWTMFNVNCIENSKKRMRSPHCYCWFLNWPLFGLFNREFIFITKMLVQIVLGFEPLTLDLWVFGAGFNLNSFDGLKRYLLIIKDNYIFCNFKVHLRQK